MGGYGVRSEPVDVSLSLLATTRDGSEACTGRPAARGFWVDGRPLSSSGNSDNVGL